MEDLLINQVKKRASKAGKPTSNSNDKKKKIEASERANKTKSLAESNIN